MLTESRKRRLLESQAADRQASRQRAVKRFLDSAPGEYQGFGIELLTDGDRDWDGALSRSGTLQLARFIKEPTRFLLLTGSTGTGKSSAACTIAEHLVASDGRSARFVSAMTMLSQFSFGNGPMSGADVLRHYSEIPLLVLDDLGSVNEGMSDHQARSLWALIDARWSNKLTTIITTNMAINATADGVGLADLLGPSAWDRIRDSVTIVEFDGRESFRGQRR